ncbi:MAG: virulence RhuM family protein [Bacteroidetes bacterium]|nr:virulence RhuM family protein [Bacteroidota bacterium]
MTMKDWIGVLDGFMKMSQQTILQDAGKFSAELAQRKALAEYETYKSKPQDELSEVEKQFLASIEQAEKQVKKLKKK